MEDITTEYNNIKNKNPHNFPSHTSMDLLMNTEKLKPNKKYVCFEEAHTFARSLELKTRKEWRAYVKNGLPGKPERPNYVPAHPDGIYKVKGWQGWKYWLGTADRGILQ